MEETPPNPESTPEPTGEPPGKRKPAAKKADKATVSQRIDEVFRIRLDGAQYHDIQQYSAEKGWNLSERQLREYMARADALLVERQDDNRQRVIARHIAQRQALFARAVNGADYRTGLAILADEAKLRGLYPDVKEVKEMAKVATVSDDGRQRPLSYDELKDIAIIAARAARAEYRQPEEPTEPQPVEKAVEADESPGALEKDDDDDYTSRGQE